MAQDRIRGCSFSIHPLTISAPLRALARSFWWFADQVEMEVSRWRKIV